MSLWGAGRTGGQAGLALDLAVTRSLCEHGDLKVLSVPSPDA